MPERSRNSQPTSPGAVTPRRGFHPFEYNALTIRSFFSLLLSLAIPVAAAAQEPVSEAPVSAPENNIVTRVNDPASNVSFDMPQALLDRVLNTGKEANSEERRDPEAAEAEDADDEKSVRTKGAKAVGYRVQVYADNNARTAKGTARQRERVISGAFPQYGTYVTYASPYWRLRVGDFRSQYDAEKAAAEIKRAFPSFAREIRVVRDRVNQR